MKRTIPAILLLCALAGAARAATTTVTIDTGMVQGVADASAVSFKGIPFAQAPVGKLRWQPPLPAKRWAGVRRADSFGPDCAQHPVPGDKAASRVPLSEDCLTLNVWAPLGEAARRRAVMVWIYGGGFVNGGTSPAIYDGSAFARDNVVLVSFNYRLGRLGFFAHPALSAESPGAPLGNYALMDQVAALHWVQKNIAVFGGDAGNVTIFGESAGGVAVHALLTSTSARGLFQKAVVESGGGRSNVLGGAALRPVPGMAPERAARSGETMGLAFAHANGITDPGPAGLAALRALPVDKVTAGLNMATLFTSGGYAGPITDGAFIRGEALRLEKAGEAAPVTIMLGANGQDGYFIGKSQEAALAPLSRGPRAEILHAYDPDGTLDTATLGWKISGDVEMIEPARAAARALSMTGHTVFLYRFSYVADAKRAEWVSAHHASEIPYVFDTLDAAYGSAVTPEDRAVAKSTHEAWVRFAQTGSPGWPAFTTAADSLMVIGPHGAAYVKDPWSARLDVAERYHPVKPEWENFSDVTPSPDSGRH